MTRNVQFEKQKREVLKEARLNGIRPMTVARLVDFLGYSISQPLLGRAGAVDKSGIQRQ